MVILSVIAGLAIIAGIIVVLAWVDKILKYEQENYYHDFFDR